MNTTLNNILKVKMSLVEREILITLFNNTQMSNIELFKFFNHRIKIENIDKAITKLINKNYIKMDENKCTFNEELFIDEIGSVKKINETLYVDNTNAEPIIFTDNRVPTSELLKPLVQETPEIIEITDDDDTIEVIKTKQLTDSEIFEDCETMEKDGFYIGTNKETDTLTALVTPLNEDVLNGSEDILPSIDEEPLSSTEDHIDSVDEESIIDEIKPSVEPLNEFKPFQIENTYNPKLLVFDLNRETHKTIIKRSNDTMNMILRCFKFTLNNGSYSNSKVIYDRLFNKVKFGDNDVILTNDLIKISNELDRVEKLYASTNDNQYLIETTRITSDKILMELYYKVNEQIDAVKNNNLKEVTKLNKHIYYISLVLTFISKYVEANPNDMSALVTYNRLRYSLDVEENFPYLLGLAIQVINKISYDIK